jgi:WD repeat-containing protein 20
VSQDTQLCLWDITEDILRQPFPHRTRLSSYDPPLVNGSGGGVDVTDDVKVLRPIASSAISSVTDNCSIISNKSNTLTRNSNKLINCVGNESSSLGRNSKTSAAGLALGNCIGKDGAAPSATNTSTISSKSSASSSISAASSDNSSHSQQQQQNNHNHHHHQSSHSAFNAITQRLTNFSFSSNNSDSKTSKPSGHNSVSSNKRNFTLSKSIVHHHNSIFNNNHTATGSASSASEPSGTLSKHSKYGAHAMTPSYDPMKLIGTPSCPRFDEVPVLEPLVCKKIAHERLTALIFREDCFLTACQDGFVYTWARPGYVVSN